MRRHRYRYYYGPHRYRFGRALLDLFLVLVTGGLWLLWMLVRYLRYNTY